MSAPPDLASAHALARRRLLVADATSPTPLVREGHPVWPVGAAAHGEALARLARVWGAELTRCDDASPLVGQVEGAVALGAVVHLADDREIPELPRLAALYAALTGRRVVSLSSVAEVRASRDVEVVVTSESALSDELLDALYCVEGRALAPGLVFGADASELWREVLLRSAAAWLESPLPVRRVHLAPGFPFERIDVAPDWRLLGDHARHADVHAAVTAGAGILSTLTHSDGVDTALSPHVVMCALDEAPHTGAMAPACVATGTCFRRNMPLAAIRGSREHVFASEVRARVFVAFTCFGIRPAPEVFGTAWSLPHAMRRSGGVGAFVTSWEVSSVAVPSVEVLCRRIGRGDAIGEVVGAHNAASWMRGHASRLCIVGDPRLRLPEPPPDHVAHEEPEFPAVVRRTLPDLAFARTVLRSFAIGIVPGQAGREVPAVAALDAYETAVLYGDDDEVTTRETLAIGALFDCLGSANSILSRTWSPFAAAQTVLPDTGTRCTVCARKTHRVDVALLLPHDVRRATEFCSNCGVVADLPPARHVTLRIGDGGGVLLEGDLPPRAARIRALIDTPIAAARRALPWPEVEGGAPAARLDGEWPLLPMRLAVFLAWSPAEFGVLGCFVRGETLRRGRVSLPLLPREGLR